MAPFAAVDTQYVTIMMKSPVSMIDVNILAMLPPNSNKHVMADSCPVLPFL